MAEIQEITDAEFDKLLEEQTPQYKKWSDLEIGKIYIVKDTGVVTTQKGESMVLSRAQKSPSLPLFSATFFFFFCTFFPQPLCATIVV